MINPIRLVALLIALLSSIGSAGQFTEMESSFSRGIGRPKEESKFFTVYNPQGSFFIKVHNGPNGKPRVSSATISVNGKEIFSPNDFKKQTEWLEKPIDLNKLNSLKVTLKSQKGASLNIQCYGVDTTPPMITSVFPLDNSTIRTTTPVVTLAYFDIHSGVISKTLKIVVNGIDLTSTFQNNGIGTFLKIPQSMALPAGLNTILVTIADRAGNRAEKQIQFTVATSNPAPIVSITSPANGALTNKTPINVAWSVNGATQNIQTTENLVEGVNKIKRSYTDQAGNTGVDSVIITLDTKGPDVAITAPVNGFLTNKTPVTVAWTVDGIAQTTQLTQELVEGVNTISRTATDAAGNSATTSISVTLDTKPPGVAITAPANEFLTNKSPVVVGWTVDGVVQTSQIVEPLAEGLNIITRTATDLAGNSASVSISVTLDTKSPVVSITTPASGLLTKNTPVAVVWTVDGVVQNTETSQDLVEGVNTIKRCATDAAGNTDSTSILVTLDTQPPVIMMVSPTNGAITNAQPLHVIWTVDGTTFESDTSLPEGPQTISASAQDAAGNTGTDQVAITVDRTAPVVRISSPLNGLFTNKTPIAVAWTVDGVEQTTQLSADLTEGGNSITRTATDVAGNTGSALVGLTLDTQSPLITILSPSNNLLTNSPEIHWVWLIDGVTDSLDTTLAGDGLHTLVRSAFDAAGNVGSDSISVTLDTQSPIVEITNPVNGSLTNQPSVSVSWSVDGVTQTTLLSESLVEGVNTIIRSATDAAGNMGSDTIRVRFDGQRPEVVIALPQENFLTNQSTIPVSWSIDNQTQTTEISQILVEGINTIIRSASDSAGNIGADTVQGTLDTQAPVVAITSPVNGSLTNNPATHLVWSVDGNSYSLDTMLVGDGVHTLVRSAFDAAGNVGSDTVRLTLATSSKIVEILSPQKGSILTSSSTVFSVNELEVGARSIAMLVDGTDQTSAFSKTADMFSATLILGDGHHTFHLLTENGAGIRDTQRVSFKIKTSTAPSQIQISGTVVDAKTLQPVAGATVLVSGEIVVSTEDDGTFSIGSGGFGSIILSATKNRYTKAVRTINAIAGVDVALAPILVMPQQTDSVVVPASRDTTIALPGSNVQLDFPLNALSEQTTVSATVFDQIEQLPGEQPGMDVFLFGVDLQPHGATFTQPVTVRVPNGRQLSAGAEVPITYFNEQTGIWESVGIGMVTMDGAFVEFQTMHFSVFHGNWHIGGNGLPPNKFVLGLPPCPPGTCCLEDKGSSTITVAHGDLSNGVMIAGGPGFGDISVGLQYWSNTAKPRKVISLRLDTMPFTPTYMNWKLSLPGKDIQWLFYGPPEPTSLQYIWDATDKDGQLLPSGLYPFGERVSSIMMPGRYQYRFGAAENLYVNYTTPMVTKSYYYDFIPLVNRQASPYGAGWGIDGVLQIVGKKSTLPAEYPTTNGFRALGSQTRTSSLAGGAPVDSVALSTAMGANQGSSSGNHVMIAGTSSQGLIYWHKDGTIIPAIKTGASHAAYLTSSC